MQASKKRKKGSDEAAEDTAAATLAEAAPAPAVLKAESYTPPDPGPYPQDKPPENSVRFTPVQVMKHVAAVTCSWLTELHLVSTVVKHVAVAFKNFKQSFPKKLQARSLVALIAVQRNV